MGVIKTKGFVIKETPINDTDKMITLLTADLGKISVSARGSRKSGKSAYGTQVFTYGDYILFKGKSSYSLNSCDISTTFYELACDMERLTHAAHMMEIASDAANDSRDAGRLLHQLLYALHALKKGRNPWLVSAAFTIKLMQLVGYPPHTLSCASCNTREMEEIHFSFDRCGFVCETCAAQDQQSMHIGPGTAKAIIHVLCSQDLGVYQFELAPEVLTVFSYIALRYVSERFDKTYSKLDFLKGLSC